MAGITKGRATVGRSHISRLTAKLPKDWEVGDPKYTLVVTARKALALRGVTGQSVAFIQGRGSDVTQRHLCSPGP